MFCKNCGSTVIIFTVLAPLVTIVVLGGSHQKMTLGGQGNKPIEGRRPSQQHVVGHVKKQSNLITDSHGSLLFDPPLLDFGDCAISVIWRQKVTIRNERSDDNYINILSISGSSLHFHCSFVADKVLTPASNTSLEVVFLSREEGFVEDTLYVHTSVGSFPYQIQARGMPNPFLAKPLVNIRIPVNTTFAPLIHLYNPFSTALQVLEMFGSSCDLHLEMPSGGETESETLDWWVIPPHQSKAIAKVNFLATRATNLTAFVRIRTNYTAHPHGSLMLPIGLEVTNQPLLFCPQQYLDFGVVNQNDPPKTLKLYVINSGSRPITIQSVSASPPNDGLSIEFSPVKVLPSLITPTIAAVVTFHPSRVSNLRTTSGRIILKSKTGQYKASVGYQVAMPASYLHYNRSSTKFLAWSCMQLPACQQLSISNDFALPIHVEEATLSAQPYIELRNFTQRVLNTRELAEVLELCLVHLPNLRVPFATSLTVKTNASTLELPVSVFSGKLSVMWFDLDDKEPRDSGNQTHLFIGWLTEGSSKEVYIGLLNTNPVGVALQGWGTNSSSAVLTYLGTDVGDELHFRSRPHFHNLTMATTVRPDNYAVFQVQIHSGERQSSSLLVNVRTAYETVTLRLDYRMMAGNIYTIPAPLQWDANFLDPYLTTDVRLNSTLDQSVTVVGFQAPPSFHQKLSFDFYGNNSVVDSMQSAGIARLAYPLEWTCATPQLSKLVDDWQLGERWWNAWSDLDVVSSLYRCYETLTHSLWNEVTSVKLVTREIGFTDIPLKVNVQWPHLAVKRRVQFPLTEIGHSSSLVIKLVNPTSSAVLAQILWLENSQVNVKEFLAKLPSYLTEGIDLPTQFGPSKSNPFTLMTPMPSRSSGSDSSSSFSPDSIGPTESVMVFLAPGSQALLSVAFAPTTDQKHRALLVVKNNVTGLELISLSGHGQHARFLLGNRQPGSRQPLLFDINEKLLKNCERPWQSRYVVPSVTVKRTFTARNQGHFPITIAGFDINDSPCEGYGFRVLQCEPMTLLPNQSRSIEVAFTPDFTQTNVQRTLRLHSTVNGQDTLNFTLMATLPTHMLILCAAALPRPSWEIFLFYSAVGVTAFLLLCVMTAATLEADRILKSGLIAMITVVNPQQEYSPSTAGHLLDLKNVVREEMKASDSPVLTGSTTVPNNNNVDSKTANSTKTRKSKTKKSRPASAQSTVSVGSVPSSTPAPARSVSPVIGAASVTRTTSPTVAVNPTPKPIAAVVAPIVVTKQVAPADETSSVSSAGSSSNVKSSRKEKEELRPSKLKPPVAPTSKKVKTRTAVTNSSAIHDSSSKPNDATVDFSKKHNETQRTRSSSVPSNRIKPVVSTAANQCTALPKMAPIAASPVESALVPPAAVVTKKVDVKPQEKVTPIQPANVKPLKPSTATVSFKPTANRSQPPVGKIIPEVRRTEESALPKPIGYRYKDQKIPAWTGNVNNSWLSPHPSTAFGSCKSEEDQSWWSEENSLFSRPQETRDRFGLRSLASDVSTQDAWSNPCSPSYSGHVIRETWDTGNRSTDQSVHSLETARVYSPWTVPHWLDVTRVNGSRASNTGNVQNSVRPPLGAVGSSTVPKTTTGAAENQLSGLQTFDPFVNVRNLWESTRNMPKDSWPAYSQF